MPPYVKVGGDNEKEERLFKLTVDVQNGPP
jgi:hypothetical protein